MPSSSEHPGLLVVLSGPSGVGKTTIMKAIRDRFDAVFSVSATTRAATANEVDGVDYMFLAQDDFQQMVDDDAFLEFAQVFGKDWYGTPLAPIERALASGTMVILDIDVQGALQVRNKRADAFMMFILPPSEEELLRRLRARGRDDEDAILRRFDEAKREIATARSSEGYDAFIVNDDLHRAIAATGDAIEARLSQTA
ncbi:MAG: guanylate kinase [Planctomycetota bacterium]